jgi:phosphoribosylanthranilate isomerase
MDVGVKRLPIAAVGEKMANVLLVGVIIAKQSPRKVTCKSGKHFTTPIS